MAKKEYKSDKSILISKVIVATEDVDSSGNRLMLNLGYLDHPDKVPVTINFKEDVENIIGEAKVYLEEGVLKADISLIRDILVGYPCIQGHIIKRTGNKIEEFSIESVSICNMNVDKSIQPLEKQITKIEGENIPSFYK